MRNNVTRGLDAGDDATMVVEIWTVLLVIFLLLFVLVAGARIERVRDTPPPKASNELQAVVEGSSDPAQLILISDGRKLFTTDGAQVPASALAMRIEPDHRSVAIVVPATLRVADLDRLRRLVGEGLALPVRFGRLPESWAQRLREWSRREAQ